MTWRTMHTSHAHTQASQYLTLLSYWKRHFRRSLSQMISHNDGVWITVTENRHYKFIMTIHRNYCTDLISSYQIADWRHFAKIQPCITGRMLHCCYTNIPGKWSVHNSLKPSNNLERIVMISSFGSFVIVSVYPPVSPHDTRMLRTK